MGDWKIYVIKVTPRRQMSVMMKNAMTSSVRHSEQWSVNSDCFVCVSNVKSFVIGAVQQLGVTRPPHPADHSGRAVVIPAAA